MAAGAVTQAAMRGRATVTHGLILLEIDHFAAFERLFGEAAATALIHDAEARLWSKMPEGSGTWQAGRGRFAVSVPDCEAAGLQQLAQRVQHAFAAGAVSCPPTDVHITASAGCALASSETLTELGPTAQRALEIARRHGANRRKLLHAEQQDSAGLTRAAMHCLDNRGLKIAMLPARRLDGTGPVAFWECLARLPNEGRDAVPAARFLPAVIAAGRGPEVDVLVLEHALSMLANRPTLRVSVNLCSDTLTGTAWFSLLKSWCADDPTIADRLIVEIPSTALVTESTGAAAFAERLRRTSASLAIDSYGEPWVPHRRLAALQPDMIKLPFSQPELRERAEDHVTLAHRQDITVVATEIETQEQAALAMACGIEIAQGYLFGGPQLAPETDPEADGETFRPVRPSAFSSRRGRAFRVAPASR